MTTKVFDRDHAKLNAALVACGSVVTTEDGFTYIDETVAPTALVSAYRRLMAVGAANGMI